jgi:hypothetical protein
MLAFNQHAVFNNQVREGEGDYCWVRTGVDADGNCFFNSYVYSLDPTLYRSLSYSDRLNHVMKVKQYFSDHITLEHAIQLIDPSSFEQLIIPIETFLKERSLSCPDLRKQPLLSIEGYNQLVLSLHPTLETDTDYMTLITSIYHMYHRMITNYVQQNGSYMFDSLIMLFMKIMDMNILLISDKTGKQIPHYNTIATKYTILIYCLDNHFESIGQYKDNMMKRVFEKISFP